MTRIVPDEFFEQDGRKSPMEGLSLDTDKIRRSRFYYLNLLTEFAIRLFTKAGVPFARETFAATHCVDDAYIPLEPLASLQQPLTVVNATAEALDADALAPLARFLSTSRATTSPAARRLTFLHLTCKWPSRFPTSSCPTSTTSS